MQQITLVDSGWTLIATGDAAFKVQNTTGSRIKVYFSDSDPTSADFGFALKPGENIENVGTDDLWGKLGAGAGGDGKVVVHPNHA